MRIQEVLGQCSLERLDAEVLLAHVLQKNREWLFAHNDEEISECDYTAFLSAVERRVNHEPIAYITGKKEFYGREFFVNSHVLIPRPATEVLVEEVKRILEPSLASARDDTISNIRDYKNKIIDADTNIVIATHLFEDRIHSPITNILDIGTGSGCIAVTLALELPDVHLIATDVSSDALSVAKHNADKWNVTDRITFIEHDICNGLDKIRDVLTQPFLLVSNPPYIEKNRILQKDVSHFEPHIALFAGEKGMDVIQILQREAEDCSCCMGTVIECEMQQITD